MVIVVVVVPVRWSGLRGETGGVIALAPDLLGPVGLELTRAVEQLPGENAMPGGSRYELKWDDFLH